MSFDALEFGLSTQDNHSFVLHARVPPHPHASLLWLPALGVAAKHYLPFAETLAERGVAVFVHEWRGNGTSNLRPNRHNDWGYRQLLMQDLPLSHAAVREHVPTGARIIGGHSLGGQLAACYLGLYPHDFEQLWLIASGTPHWRSFPAPIRYGLPFFYQFAPWLADRRGALPGRKLGFGGEEARSLIRDWARVGLSGRYAAAGLDINLEAALSNIVAHISCVMFEDDWLAPRSSLQALLEKMPLSTAHTQVLGRDVLDVRADHFGWMKQPSVVAEELQR
jgi:predicted alpha/beta hydrolase